MVGHTFSLVRRGLQALKRDSRKVGTGRRLGEEDGAGEGDLRCPSASALAGVVCREPDTHDKIDSLINGGREGRGGSSSLGGLNLRSVSGG